MATVTVGCKLPHGIHMDVDGKRVTLNGVNSAKIIGGHGITENVDKDHFDKFMAMHKESPMVKNKLIFAHEKESNVAAQAKDQETNRNGFEAIDPDKPGPGIERVKEAK